MSTFSPSSITHLEFAGTTQTVVLVNDEQNEYIIKDVVYQHENGVTFDDIVIMWKNNTFTYQSRFDNAVDRVVHYSVVDDTGTVLVEHVVNNFYNLPEEYAAIHQVENPQESTNVMFIVSGLHRYLITTTDSESGETTERWSEWESFAPKTFVATITTNFDKHMQLIREYLIRGSYAKFSPTKPFG